MKQFYTAEDVIRWEKVNAEGIRLHLEKLATGLPEQGVDFHLSMLSLAYDAHGMTLIARGAFKEAINAFRASGEALCKMYERFETGQGRSLEAGHFQSVLISYVTKDSSLISRLVRHYRADDGTPGSVFLGRAMKLLAMGEIEGAKKALGGKRPRFESQFNGYADCLHAVADLNEERFASALRLASGSWAKWASRAMKGLPDSVCFVQGVGLLRLAEQVLGKAIAVSNEHMPRGLLE
jgi:hypothetical protein